MLTLTGRPVIWKQENIILISHTVLRLRTSPEAIWLLFSALILDQDCS